MPRIAVINSDCEYRKRLSAYLEAEYSGNNEFYLFPDFVSSCAEQLKKTDVILSDVPVGDPGNARVLMFADCVKYDPDGIPVCVSRYTGIPELIEIAGKLCAEYRNKNGEKLRQRGITVFTSPFGGTGTSVIAEAYARKLNMKNGGVLKISLNPYDVLIEKNCPDTGGMSGILMGIRIGADDIAGRIVRASGTDSFGVKKICGFSDARDSLELTADDMEAFTGALCKAEVGHTVIDIPFSLSPAALKLFSECGRLFIVTRSLKAYREGAEKCRTLLGELLKDSCPEITVIENLCVKNNCPDETYTDESIRIPLFEGLNREGVINEIFRNGFAEKWI